MTVIPVQAGIQNVLRYRWFWTPACAGVTELPVLG